MTWTLKAHDTFTDTDYTPIASHTPDLGTGWTDTTGNGYVHNNAYGFVSAGQSAYALENTSLAAVQAAEVVYLDETQFPGVLILAGWDGTNLSGYLVLAFSAIYHLYRLDGSGTTSTLLAFGGTAVAGDLCRLEARGDGLVRLIVNGTELYSATDSTWVSGKAGTVAFSLGVVDEFWSYDQSTTTYTLTADAGSFTLAGQAAGLLFGHVVGATAGAFTVTGSAGLLFGHKVVSAAGAFTVAGQPANLIPPMGFQAESGSFTLTGQDATLRYGTTIIASAGVFTLVGSSAGLLAARRVSAGQGAYGVAGQAAQLDKGRRVGADAAIFTLAGQVATLRPGRRLAAGSRSFSVVGRVADLLWSGAPAPPEDITSGQARTGLLFERLPQWRILMDVPMFQNDVALAGIGGDAVAGSLDLAEMALVASDIPIDANTTYAELEAAKATYGTYAVGVITWSAATRADDGSIEFLGTCAEFRPVNSTTPNSIYGFYIRNAAHSDTLFQGRFDGAPLPMESVLDSIRVTVRYRPGSNSLLAVLS